MAVLYGVLRTGMEAREEAVTGIEFPGILPAAALRIPDVRPRHAGFDRSRRFLYHKGLL
jgi:hypothetical protein